APVQPRAVGGRGALRAAPLLGQAVRPGRGRRAARGDRRNAATRLPAPERRRRIAPPVACRGFAILGRMVKRRSNVGDRVLASRDESGENHEAGDVVDSYELIIGEQRRPVVVVEFEDGERKYMTAATPNVLPLDEEEPEAGAAEDAEASAEDE